MQYAIVSDNLCNCPFYEIHIITNLNPPNDKLIAKIYLGQNNDIFQNESQICQILTNHNNENILRLRNNNIEIIGLDEFGPEVNCLIFDYLNHGKLFQYLELQENKSHFTEKIVKYIGYKLLRAIQIMHSNHIAHNRLTIDNIMLNQSFEPIIIHFKDAVLDLNNNNCFFEDFKGYAKILAKLITNGKFKDLDIGINKNGKKGFVVLNNMGTEHPLDKFWKTFSKSENISKNFIDFFKLLISTRNLNISNLINDPWFSDFNEIDLNGNIDLIGEESRKLFEKIYKLNEEFKKDISTERYDQSDIIEEDKKDDNNSLFESTMRGEAKEDLNKIFEKFLIRETRYKPMGVSYDYLILEISNYNHDNSFLKKFMCKLFLNLEDNSIIEGFEFEPEKTNLEKNKFLSFDVYINKLKEKLDFNEDDFINEENLVPEEVENEFEEIDQSLVINFELVKFKENNKNENKENENINSNKEIFYLLFNFSQGEISNYYHCVKIFKEKAKIILKSFFKNN